MDAAHVYALSLYFFIPITLARLLTRGTWREILNAYGLWLALLLLLFAVPAGRAYAEGIGWAMIIAMFTTVIAVPVLVVVQKLVRKFRLSAAK